MKKIATDKHRLKKILKRDSQSELGMTVERDSQFPIYRSRLNRNVLDELNEISYN